MIYVAKIQDGKFIKVGFSGAKSVSERLSTLQTGCPYKIDEVFCIEGTLMQEQAIHGALKAAFARVRIPMPPNEWYPGKTPFFKEFLENLKYGFDFGLTFLEKYNVAVKQPSTKIRKNKANPNYEPQMRWPG